MNNEQRNFKEVGMEEKPNYYAVIPAKVRYDNDLTPNEKLLYGEITALTNKNDECWASNKYFSELYNVQVQSVSRWLKHLKDKNYIEIHFSLKHDSKEIEKRIIKINDTPINKNVNTYSQNCLGGINKNVKDNNTSINNINNNKYIWSLFEKFWKAYPKKVKKQDSKKWFEKNKPSEELVETMIKQIERFKQTEQWQKENGKFIPHPTTWLNDERWEDEFEIKTEKPKPERHYFN